MATGCTYPTRPVAEEQLEGGRQGAHSPGHSVLSLSVTLSLSLCVYVCESSLSSTGALKIPGQEAGACCAFTVNLVVALSRAERGRCLTANANGHAMRGLLNMRMGETKLETSFMYTLERIYNL